VNFIKKLSYSSAKAIQTAKKEEHYHRRIYHFGFQVIYGGITKIILLVLLSLLTFSLWPTLVLTLTFAIVRSISGGYHMGTYSRCLVISIFLFAFGGAAAQHIHQDPLITAIVVNVFCTYCFIRYAPMEHHNRPFTEGERKKFRLLSFYLLVGIGWVVQPILIYFGHYVVSLAISFGIALECFTMTRTGIKLFSMMDKGGII
jgi:accessory gene regulator B